MIYPYSCECGETTQVSAPISVGPPSRVGCNCGQWMNRVWTPPYIICDTDPDFVPLHARVTENTGFGDTKAEGHRKERAYQRVIEEKRKNVRLYGDNPNFPKMTHQVPTELYHGKIKETGDKRYWDDPSNLKKHKSCKVTR